MNILWKLIEIHFLKKNKNCTATGENQQVEVVHKWAWTRKSRRKKYAISNPLKRLYEVKKTNFFRKVEVLLDFPKPRATSSTCWFRPMHNLDLLENGRMYGRTYARMWIYRFHSLSRGTKKWGPASQANKFSKELFTLKAQSIAWRKNRPH